MRSLITLVLTTLACCAGGCALPGGGPSSETPAAPVTDLYTPSTSTGIIKRALVVGYTHVDPAAYGGWDGDCPGCDVDAEVAALRLQAKGFEVILYHNAEGTKDRLEAAALAATIDMRPQDLFVIVVSGHGGQVADTSGDEDDGFDETICLWDGQATDDWLGTVWSRMRGHNRVLFVTDTCNSGTNYRSRRSIRRSVPRDYAGQLIHIGGCADGQSSYGDAQGGVMSTALWVDSWRDDATYAQWYAAMAALMPFNQRPAWAEYGRVTDAFRNGRALE